MKAIIATGPLSKLDVELSLERKLCTTFNREVEVFAEEISDESNMWKISTDYEGMLLNVLGSTSCVWVCCFSDNWPI